MNIFEIFENNLSDSVILKKNLKLLKDFLKNTDDGKLVNEKNRDLYSKELSLISTIAYRIKQYGIVMECDKTHLVSICNSKNKNCVTFYFVTHFGQCSISLSKDIKLDSDNIERFYKNSEFEYDYYYNVVKIIVDTLATTVIY